MSYRHFITLLAVICALISAYSEAGAMWAKLSDTELAARSDVIIVAELVEQKQISVDSARITVGALQVEEVLKGDEHLITVLLLLPSPGALKKSDDIYYTKGQKGLWFLRLKPGGPPEVYLADHPQRFSPTHRMQDQLDAVRKSLSPSP